MRNNQPVTNVEIALSDQFSIMSTTDLQGNITYGNPYFVEISGYTLQELIGAPQNILRHPSMPTEAFADLWKTIKGGDPWTGMVKNRTKSGDFYWVLANVTPIFENDKSIGYMSVRTKPSREQVAQAEALYAAIRNGNQAKLRVERGRPVSGTAFWWSKYSAVPRINLSFVFVLLSIMVLAVGTIWPAALPVGWLAGAAALGLWSTVYAGILLHSKILQPLKLATQSACVMAGGDLTQTIAPADHDDVGQLQNALRQMNINLRSIIGDVRSNFETIRVATHEIASGNLDLSNRTETQASNLEETAASMDELTSSVQQSAENATQANALANTASKVAAQSGAVVSQMVDTMQDINTSSRKIVDFIALIDGIAFQTNILALNAAVEAARAGEQGRGFAVVAAEVRSLAQRSASAAKEIKQLIDVSLTKVESGMTLTSNAGGAMQEVINSVNRVESIISEITIATREQSTGIREVNQAVAQLDTVTQQNAALVEQAAAAAGNLSEQTDNLTNALAIFRVPGGVSAPRASRQSRIGLS